MADTRMDDLNRELRDASRKLSLIVNACRDENRDLTASEQREFNRLEAEIRQAQEEIGVEEMRWAAELRETEEQRQAKAAQARRGLGLGESEGNGTDVVVRSESATYSRGSGRSYFHDLASATVRSDRAAAERLERHSREMALDIKANPSGVVARTIRDHEVRAGLTTAVGSGGTFLPPAYLLDAYIKYPRPARVLSNLIRKVDLPRGPMTIEIPKIISPTLVNSQTTQNTTITEQDLTDEYVSAPVVTVAGQQTVSLQAVEQSGVPYDEIIFSDLEMALDLDIETQVVAGSGTSNQMTGVLTMAGAGSVTYTSGTPAATALYPLLAQAIGTVYTAIFRPADFIMMTPMRWAWIQSATDNSGRPLVVPEAQGPYNVMALQTGQLTNAARSVGSILGVPVYTSAAIPTNLGSGANQDQIIVGSSQDLVLWEAAPVVRALPQTLGTTLSVLLQVYEYAAFMPNRLPGAVCVISGTGLTTPAF